MAKMDTQQYEGMMPAAALVMGGLDFGRERLTAAIKDLTPEQLLKKPAGFKNNIATLVLHIGSNEVGFSHRIMGRTVSDELKAEYLVHVPGQPLSSPETADAADLIAKLDQSRGFVLQALQGLTEADLGKEFQLGPERSATIRWMLAIHQNHQMQHYGHIQMIIQHL